MPLAGFGEAAGECLTGEEYGPGPADEEGRLRLPPYDRLFSDRDEFRRFPLGSWNGGGDEASSPLLVKDCPGWPAEKERLATGELPLVFRYEAPYAASDLWMPGGPTACPRGERLGPLSREGLV